MVTQSTQTQDVYKSVQLQTSSKHNVASNTMSEKGTSTSQSMAYLWFVHSEYNPNAAIKYGDIDDLVYWTRTILPSIIKQQRKS